LEISRRKSHLLVPAGGQRGRVLLAGPFWSPGVHDGVQRLALAVCGHVAVVRRAGWTIRQLGTDGLQRGLCDQLLAVVLRRSVRAQTPRHAHRRPQPVLLRRLPVHHHAVRGHRRLADVRALHRNLVARQHCGPV